MNRADILLNRLEYVRKSGPDRWRAKCPAHAGKSTSSLSIREIDDGRVLVHCHGGCPTAEVLAVCGLEFADLMPERITHHATPEQRKKWRQEALHRDWRECAEELLHEARIVWVAGFDIGQMKPLGTDDTRRLDLAVQRIERIGRLFDGND